jgi:hypothetical protein
MANLIVKFAYATTDPLWSVTTDSITGWNSLALVAFVLCSIDNLGAKPIDGDKAAALLKRFVQIDRYLC